MEQEQENLEEVDVKSQEEEVSVEVSDINEISVAVPVLLSPSRTPPLEKRCSIRLDQEWVQVLINLRMKYAKLFMESHTSASEAWKLIFKELEDTGAPSTITLPKIKKKWMNLMTRYRQIKNTSSPTELITWPYYEQINRAYGKHFGMLNADGKNHLDNESNMTSFDNDRKKDFIMSLIEMRYNHRHFFTGKKYAAREGWCHIQSLLNCKDIYTVEQLSKCWQNLIQRYKLLKKSNKPISWPYYQQIHNFFADESCTNSQDVDNKSVCELHSENSLIMDTDSPEPKRHCSENRASTSRATHCKCLNNIQSVLREIKDSQEKQFDEILGVLNSIQEQVVVI